jgi:hypothetical protein
MGFTKNKTESEEKEKYTRFIDKPGAIEKIKQFEREFLSYLGKTRTIEQRNGGEEVLYAWEMFLMDRNIITYPLGGYGYSVIVPGRLTEFLELRKGLDDLNERRAYAKKMEEERYT